MLITLSKVTTPVISWISQLLGWLMNGIYEALYAIGTEKIGFSIIIYTLIGPAAYLLKTKTSDVLRTSNSPDYDKKKPPKKQ